MAHFKFATGETSLTVAHHNVEEIWYFMSGRGEMWRKLGDKEEVVDVRLKTASRYRLAPVFNFVPSEKDRLSH